MSQYGFFKKGAKVNMVPSIRDYLAGREELVGGGKGKALRREGSLIVHSG